MKKFLLAIAILGAIGYQYQHKRSAEAAGILEPIENPVYAEIKVGLDVGSRSFDQVLLIKTVDRADCENAQQRLQSIYGPNAVKSGQNWQIKSSECMLDLEPRYLKLFDNRPTYVTYFSMARGSNREDREFRIVTWGVSVDESNKLCDTMALTQKSRKGTPQCIRAVPSQS